MLRLGDYIAALCPDKNQKDEDIIIHIFDIEDVIEVASNLDYVKHLAELADDRMDSTVTKCTVEIKMRNDASVVPVINIYTNIPAKNPKKNGDGNVVVCVLDTNSIKEFIGQIVDIFEDYLTEHFVPEGEDPNSKVFLEGANYDFMKSEIEISIGKYNLILQPIRERSVMDAVAEHIVAGFHVTKHSVGCSEKTPDEDIHALKEKVKETFKNWNLYIGDMP